ncbi:hypothetical protein I204_05897 [Kwoniella mangroviensis CBS 8886]|nr:hypothetical protein I204_05897 [Kwoniella mangroviensis CBS 8886]
MSVEEDMSLTPISPTSPATANLPTVELSFDTSKGGAWDDRELIRASEAAMKEFHAHHPGPGSWLDKATAALAKGQKLPGADDYGTAWYSASLPTETEVQAEPSTSTQTQVKMNGNANGNQSQSNKRRKTKRTNLYDTNMPNPYLPSTSTSTSTSTDPSQPTRRQSPSYNPGSPSSRPIQVIDSDSDTDSEEEYYDEDEEEEEYDEDAEWDLPPQQQQQQQYGSGYDQLFPSLGVYPPGGINREEALGYAMTAQYWAGYWMGVAQSQNQGNGLGYQPGQKEKRSKRRKRVNFDMGDENEEDITIDAVKSNQMNGNGNVQPSNLKVTKKRFDPVINGLRR